MPLSMPNKIPVCFRVCERDRYIQRYKYRQRERENLFSRVSRCVCHWACRTEYLCVCVCVRDRYIYTYRERTYSLGFPVVYATEHAEQNICVCACVCERDTYRERERENLFSRVSRCVCHWACCTEYCVCVRERETEIHIYRERENLFSRVSNHVCHWACRTEHLCAWVFMPNGKP